MTTEKKTLTTLDPITKLAALAAQRTVRTDRLYSAVTTLLAQLDDVCEVGDYAHVDGYTLRRVRLHSNVGSAKLWAFADCYLGEPVNGKGYLHGDFGRPLNGPSRADLLHFAQRSARFVAAFIAQRETEALELDAGTQRVSGLEVR